MKKQLSLCLITAIWCTILVSPALAEVYPNQNAKAPEETLPPITHTLSAGLSLMTPGQIIEYEYIINQKNTALKIGSFNFITPFASTAQSYSLGLVKYRKDGAHGAYYGGGIFTTTFKGGLDDLFGITNSESGITATGIYVGMGYRKRYESLLFTAHSKLGLNLSYSQPPSLFNIPFYIQVGGTIGFSI
jgi:hypothetical protein